MTIWKPSEIEKYISLSRGRNNETLNQLYEEKDISENNPEGRAKYLAETAMQLTMIDHEVLMSVAASKGRAAGLILLEDIFLTNQK